MQRVVSRVSYIHENKREACAVNCGLCKLTVLFLPNPLCYAAGKGIHPAKHGKALYGHRRCYPWSVCSCMHLYDDDTHPLVRVGH